MKQGHERNQIIELRQDKRETKDITLPFEVKANHFKNLQHLKTREEG